VACVVLRVYVCACVSVWRGVIALCVLRVECIVLCDVLFMCGVVFV
jgi:hypothetical protein